MSDNHGPESQFSTNVGITVGTLATLTPIKGTSRLDGSRNQGYHLIYAKLAGFFAGKTATEGPLIFGLWAGATISQIAAYFNDDPQNRQASRGNDGAWVRVLSVIGVDSTEGDLLAKQGDVNVQGTSRFEREMVKWSIPENQAFGVFLFNLDSGTLTTGMTANVQIELFGSWLRD